MMIEFSANTFQRLQGIKKPDETTELVVRRLLDFFDSKSSPASPESKQEIDDFATAGGVESTSASSESIDDYGSLNWLDDGMEKYEKFLENAKKDPKIFPHTAIPDLKHTKCYSIKIGDTKIPKPNWNSAVRTILKQVTARGITITSPYFHGLKISDENQSLHGFKYISEIGKSVQGADANQTARALFDMAREYDILVEVSFQWRAKPSVKNPGLRGVIAFSS